MCFCIHREFLRPLIASPRRCTRTETDIEEPTKPATRTWPCRRPPDGRRGSSRSRQYVGARRRGVSGSVCVRRPAVRRRLLPATPAAGRTERTRRRARSHRRHACRPCLHERQRGRLRGSDRGVGASGRRTDRIGCSSSTSTLGRRPARDGPIVAVLVMALITSGRYSDGGPAPALRTPFPGGGDPVGPPAAAVVHDGRRERRRDPPARLRDRWRFLRLRAQRRQPRVRDRRCHRPRHARRADVDRGDQRLAQRPPCRLDLGSATARPIA